MKKSMNPKTDHPFTAEQFNGLAPEERVATLAVAKYLTGGIVAISDEDLSFALNILKETEGF